MSTTAAEGMRSPRHTSKRTKTKKRGTSRPTLLLFLLLGKILLVALFAVADGGLRGGKAGNRHTEGRAAYVVQTDLVAELDAFGFAAMLAGMPSLMSGRTSFADFTAICVSVHDVAC